MDKISIIIPCFNEEEALPIYYTEMKKVMDTMKKQTFSESRQFSVVVLLHLCRLVSKHFAKPDMTREMHISNVSMR